MTTEGLTVIGLEVSNLKRVRAVRIEPHSPVGVVEIAGRNGAGKSTVLDAILYALAGKEVQPSMPIRRGATDAKDVLELQDASGKHVLTVTRTWSGAGRSYLKVEKVGEGQIDSPQSFLDSLVGAGVGFDPLSFAQLPPVKQVEMLLSVLKLDEDPRTLDVQKQAHYTERTVVNREVKTLKAQLDALPDPGDVPDAEVSITALAEEMERLSAIREENARTRDSAKRIEVQIDRLTESLVATRTDAGRAETLIAEAASRVASVREALDSKWATARMLSTRVEALRTELAEADAALREKDREITTDERALDALERNTHAVETTLTEMRQTIARDEEGLTHATTERDVLTPKLAAMTDPDVDAVKERMRTAEATNAKVRAKLARREAVEKLLAKQKAADALTAKMGRLDERKREVLASAAFPIPNVGFEMVNGEYAVTYNGVPLDGCSESERIRVGMALALALNPSIRVVLIRNGSLLDDDSMAIVREMAKDAGAQVWLETVGAPDTDEAFTIVDGELSA